MKNKMPVIPAMDANESQKAYRERIAKERAEEQERQQFNKFVTDKREDYAMTALSALLQNPSHNASDVDANVEIAFKYADAMLYKLYYIKFASQTKKEEASSAPEEDKDAQADTKVVD